MDDDRAQLMLVGAITIAVIFLGLVAVLNTGLYTSNVAPRAGLSATADAGTFVDGVEHDVPTLLGAAAEGNIERKVYAFDSTIRDEVDQYGTYLLRSIGSERAATVNVSVIGQTYDDDGWLLVDDNASREFAPHGTSDRNWTLAEDVDTTNGTITLYRFPADSGALDATNNSTHTAPQNATFALEADGDGEDWRLETYWENDSGGRVHVDVSDGTPNCTFPQNQPTNASGVTIDLTDGNVRGIDCSFDTVDDELDGDDEPYDLWIRRSGADDATRARGTYSIAVEGATDDDVHDGDVEEGSPDETDVPYSVPQLDTVTLALQYTAPSLDYDTEIEVESDAVDLPPPPLTGGGTVFVNESSGHLRSIDDGDWETRTYDANDTERIGPADIDFDADGRVEIPHVNDSVGIRLIDVTNESRTLPAGEIERQSRLAVGTWNGSPVSVFYAGNGTINRTTPGARAPARLNATATGDGVRAPVGPADVDNDSSREFVYVDSEGQIRYFHDANGTTTTTDEVNVTAAAVGPAYDFDGDGAAEVPFLDVMDGNISLVNGTGPPVDLFETHGISSDEPVDAAPLAVRDVNDDGDMEIVYLRGGQTYYLENVGTGAVNNRRLPPKGDDLGNTNTSTTNASEEQGVA